MVAFTPLSRLPLLAADADSEGNFADLTVDWWVWAGLVGLILALLLVDLLVFHRRAHDISTKEAAIESTVWIDRLGATRRAPPTRYGRPGAARSQRAR